MVDQTVCACVTEDSIDLNTHICGTTCLWNVGQLKLLIWMCVHVSLKITLIWIHTCVWYHVSLECRSGDQQRVCIQPMSEWGQLHRHSQRVHLHLSRFLQRVQLWEPWVCFCLLFHSILILPVWVFLFFLWFFSSSSVHVFFFLFFFFLSVLSLLLNFVVAVL